MMMKMFNEMRLRTIKDKFPLTLINYKRNSSITNQKWKKEDYSSLKHNSSIYCSLQKNIPLYDINIYLQKKNIFLQKPRLRSSETNRTNLNLFKTSKQGFSIKIKTYEDKTQIIIGDDFKHLVQNSSVFSDKTLFIKEILEDSSRVNLITMPGRWGKSLNLNMLKTFLEIQVDENGEKKEITDNSNYSMFFKNNKIKLDIADAKIKRLFDGEFYELESSELFGNFPVIYIDFKDCEAESYDVLLDKVATKMEMLFESHVYLKNDENIRDNYNRYLELLKKRNISMIENGIYLLSYLLYKHFKKRVWILIDEYDCPANTAFRKFEDINEIEKVFDLYRRMLQPALKDSPYLEKGVITGVQYLLKTGLFSGLNNFIKYDITDLKYAQFYGIDQEEMKDLLNYYNITDKTAEDIKSWYNGYIVGGREKYNIWSVFNYLYSPDLGLKPYWEETGSLDFMKIIFKHDSIREIIGYMLLNEEVDLNITLSFTFDEYKMLRDMILGKGKINDDQVLTNLIFSILYVSGYITKSNSGKYLLPNNEIKYKMKEYIAEELFKTYGISTELSIYCGELMNSLFDNENYSKDRINNILEEFRISFAKLLKESNLTCDVNNGVLLNESIIHSILNFLMFIPTPQFKKFRSDHRNPNGNRLRPDIYMSNDVIGIIIEIKYDKSDNIAFDQAKTYKDSIKKEQHKLLIGLNVSNKKEVTIMFDYINQKD